MKKVISGNSSLFMSIIEIILGVLLLIKPVEFTSGIIVGFGVVMIAMGLFQIIKYFRTPAAEASEKGLLTKGLLFVVLGVFCVLKSGWIISTFPVITALYGVLIFVTGISKLQQSVDMIRIKQKFWFIALISAVVTLAISVIVILNPFTSTVVLWRFIGITLILQAVIDLITFFFSKKAQKA